MKKTLLILLLGSLFVSTESCKKENAEQYGDPAITILGTWELRQTSFAMYRTPNNHPSGNGNIFKFTANGYETFANGVLVKKGPYTITADSSIGSTVIQGLPKDQFLNRIDFDSPNQATKIFFQVIGNKLTFYSGDYSYDAGHSEVYEKITYNP